MGVFSQKGYFENGENYFKDHSGGIIYSKFRVSLSYNGSEADNVTVYFNLPENLWMTENPIFIE